MYQIYLLTVLSTTVVGFMVAAPYFIQKFEGCLPVINAFSKPNTKMALSLISFLMGIISLFKPLGVVFIGDILPAAGAILGGIIIGSQALGEKSDVPPAFVTTIAVLTEKMAVPLGFAIMAAGLLHAIVPTAIIL